MKVGDLTYVVYGQTTIMGIIVGIDSTDNFPCRVLVYDVYGYNRFVLPINLKAVNF